MGEKEDKEKAEKLAVAKKRFAQIQKAKKKAGGGVSGAEKSSIQNTRDEEAKSPTKQGGEEQRQIESEVAKVDEKTGEEAVAMTHAESPSSEIVQSSETTLSDAGRRDGPLEDSIDAAKGRGSMHGGEPSLSIQSKMRSDSFRRTSTSGPLSPGMTMGGLPPLTPDGETMNEIYRKQALRLEDLERDNKRLEKEARDGESRWRRSEEELEELREASGEASALKAEAKRAEEAHAEIFKLKAEIVALQRQVQQRGHSLSISKSMRPSGNSGSGDIGSSFENQKKELDSKDSAIADMELEISKLRGELSSKTSGCQTHGSQISALQDNLTLMQNRLRKYESELADCKKALTRASEKAVKDGVEKTSSDTRMKSLERQLAETSATRDDIVKKAEILEKKIETMNKLHREAEARNSSKLISAETQAREAGVLKARLVAAENENLRLREERDRRKRREASGGDDEGLDELEDEERVRLERRVRELEGEIFDLKRGVWRERRKEMQLNPETGAEATPSQDDAGDFDEVDLSGTGPASRLLPSLSQQKHSSFSTVLNSGLAAFRGSPEHTSRPRQDSLLPELDDDNAFDEQAFALAQREEEARKMVEHVREVKRKLREWEGWRLDLVDARSAAGMLGTGLGEIFEV